MIWSLGQSEKAEQKPSRSSSSEGSVGGAKGGGKRAEEDQGVFMEFNGKKFYEFKFDGQKWGWIPLGLAVAVGYALTRNNSTRHISWQEFRTQYLERGEVERLQVVDRNVVRVYLRRDASMTNAPGVRHTCCACMSMSCPCMLQAPSYLTFNIGSVDSFERNLEQAQKEIGIHPSDYVPVTYKPDSDWLKSFLINVFPTALLVGAIYFMSRRASGSKGVSCNVRLLFKETAILLYFTLFRDCLVWVSLLQSSSTKKLISRLNSSKFAETSVRCDL